jgi:hypothetical protein
MWSNVPTPVTKKQAKFKQPYQHEFLALKVESSGLRAAAWLGTSPAEFPWQYRQLITNSNTYFLAAGSILHFIWLFGVLNVRLARVV